MERNKKAFRFEVKRDTLNEDGAFTGFASTYGNVDQGDDVVDPGAFTKTLQDRGNEVPLLWSHDSKQPIGLGVIEDSPNGLVVKGQLDLDTQVGRETYSRMKKGIVKGLSIGFETVKRNVKDGIRHLTELKLFEVSLCVFPMNEKATVSNVKAREEKDDFLTELDEAQTWSFRYQSLSALNESLCETLADAELPDEEKAAQSSVSIQQFHDAYMEHVPKMLALMANSQSVYYATKPAEFKAGRKLSATTRKRIEDSIAQLQALLLEAAEPSTSGLEAATPEAAKTSANTIEPKPLVHSLVCRRNTFLETLRSK